MIIGDPSYNFFLRDEEVDSSSFIIFLTVENDLCGVSDKCTVGSMNQDAFLICVGIAEFAFLEGVNCLNLSGEVCDSDRKARQSCILDLIASLLILLA